MEAEAAMAPAAATGAVRVEKVRGRSAVTRCFAKYPLKLIAPSKAGRASSGAAWLYAITYGGGIVSVSRRIASSSSPGLQSTNQPTVCLLSRERGNRECECLMRFCSSFLGAVLVGGHHLLHGGRRRRVRGGDDHAGLH
ncbi:hypothetical protein EE612_009150 [Oryza sativa]|nr:hypothetical protein EE612_009150 [Oryza sativa]